MSVHVEQRSAQPNGAQSWARGSVRSSIVDRESAFAVLTLVRVALVPVFVLSFLAQPLVTTISLSLFILADIYDGVLARLYNADGPYRRALDSTVDRVGIDAFFVGAFIAGALPWPLFLALLLRDAYCAAICLVMMRTRRVAIKADWLYRSLNLSIAVWALSAPYMSQAIRDLAASLILVASIGVATDLTRSVRRVLGSAPQIRNRVIAAGRIRTRLAW